MSRIFCVSVVWYWCQSYPLPIIWNFTINYSRCSIDYFCVFFANSAFVALLMLLSCQILFMSHIAVLAIAILLHVLDTQQHLPWLVIIDTRFELIHSMHNWMLFRLVEDPKPLHFYIFHNVLKLTVFSWLSRVDLDTALYFWRCKMIIKIQFNKSLCH